MGDIFLEGHLHLRDRLGQGFSFFFLLIKPVNHLLNHSICIICFPTRHIGSGPVILKIDVEGYECKVDLLEFGPRLLLSVEEVVIHIIK